MIRKTISLVLAAALGFGPSLVHAQQAILSQLPAPGIPVASSIALEPLLPKGLQINPDAPLSFSLIVDAGDVSASEDYIREEGQRFGRYFMAAVAVPEGELWVNLSPHERDRMITDALGQTDLGRDMLAQDYLLKQVTATALHPDQEIGKAFWKKVYERAYEKHGVTEVPVDAFNKVWIMPQTAEVFEQDNAVYVTEAKLKVMLDADYLAAQKNQTIEQKADEKISSTIMRDVVIPTLEEEINHGKNFAQIRQIFHAVILAKWYRQQVKDTLMDQAYVGKSKVNGVDVKDKEITSKIYEQYLQAYRTGVVDMVREDVDLATGDTIPRKYFSGGEVLHGFDLATASDAGAVQFRGDVSRVDFAMAADGLDQSKIIIENWDYFPSNVIWHEATSGRLIEKTFKLEYKDPESGEVKIEVFTQKEEADETFAVETVDGSTKVNIAKENLRALKILDDSDEVGDKAMTVSEMLKEDLYRNPHSVKMKTEVGYIRKRHTTIDASIRQNEYAFRGLPLYFNITEQGTDHHQQFLVKPFPNNGYDFIVRHKGQETVTKELTFLTFSNAPGFKEHPIRIERKTIGEEKLNGIEMSFSISQGKPSKRQFFIEQGVGIELPEPGSKAEVIFKLGDKTQTLFVQRPFNGDSRIRISEHRDMRDTKNKFDVNMGEDSTASMEVFADGNGIAAVVHFNFEKERPNEFLEINVRKIFDTRADQMVESYTDGEYEQVQAGDTAVFFAPGAREAIERSESSVDEFLTRVQAKIFFDLMEAQERWLESGEASGQSVLAVVDGVGYVWKKPSALSQREGLYIYADNVDSAMAAEGNSTVELLAERRQFLTDLLTNDDVIKFVKDSGFDPDQDAVGETIKSARETILPLINAENKDESTVEELTQVVESLRGKSHPLLIQLRQGIEDLIVELNFAFGKSEVDKFLDWQRVTPADSAMTADKRAGIQRRLEEIESELFNLSKLKNLTTQAQHLGNEGSFQDGQIVNRLTEINVKRVGLEVEKNKLNRQLSPIKTKLRQFLSIVRLSSDSAMVVEGNSTVELLAERRQFLTDLLTNDDVIKFVKDSGFDPDQDAVGETIKSAREAVLPLINAENKDESTVEELTQVVESLRGKSHPLLIQLRQGIEDLIVELNFAFGKSEVDKFLDWQRVTPADADKAQAVAYGGIDLNQVDLAMNGDGSGFTFDSTALQALIDKGFSGLTPIVINVVNLPIPLISLGITK